MLIKNKTCITVKWRYSKTVISISSLENITIQEYYITLTMKYSKAWCFQDWRWKYKKLIQKTNKRKMWCFKVSRSPEFKTKCQIIAFLIIWNVLFWICILINLYHYSSRKWCGSLFWQYKEISAFRSKYATAVLWVLPQ